MVGLCKFRTKLLKICRNFILFLFVFVLLTFAISQTRWGKEQVKNRLIIFAKQHHIELSFEELDELLPFKWKLNNVTLALPNQTSLKAKTVTLGLSYFPLTITSIEMQEANYLTFPFSLDAKGAIFFSSQELWRIHAFHIDSQLIHLNGSAALSSNGSIQNAECCFHIPDLKLWNFPSALQGNVEGKLEVQSKFAHVTLGFHELKLENYFLGNLNADVLTSLSEKQWKGNAIVTAEESIIPFHGSIPFQYDPQSTLLSMNEIEIQGPESHLYGDLTVNPLLLDWHSGFIHVQACNLEHFRPLIPESFLTGSLGANIDFLPKSITAHGKLNNVHFFSTSLQNAECKVDLSKDFLGTFSITGECLTTHQGSFSTFELKTFLGTATSPFYFFAEGNPLTIFLEGNWNKNISFECTELSGHIFNEPFAIKKPFHMEWDENHFLISPFLLKIADGELFTHIDLNSSSSFAKITGQKFPLKLATLFQKPLSLEGTSDFSLDITAHERHVQGSINLNFHGVDLYSHAKKDPLKTKGTLQLHLNENQLQINGNLKTACGQLLDVAATIPVLFEPFPFKFSTDQETHFTSEIFMEGKVEDLLQFVNIGDQQLDGNLFCHLHLSNTLKKPFYHGTIELQNGNYENHTFGVSLKQFNAHAKAHGQEIKLLAFDALDETKGTISGTGTIYLDPKEKTLYSIESTLNQFQAISRDTLEGKFTGTLLFTGTLREATARGNLSVTEAFFKIPEKLLSPVPDLAITLINPPDSLLKKPLAPLTFFPLNLDVTLDASKRVFLEWKGLNSEWKGKLHVTGNHVNVRAKGALSLIKGEYLFAGKAFTLTSGEMTFNDLSSPATFLSLNGSLDLTDCTVNVILRGPLFSPTLTFQSNPTMATSSLLARILFNKDISDISGVQAIQLTQTLISLSGDTAPNVLERIRKTLLIDRLNLITSDNDPEKMLVQISKYVTKGVMLTLSQGTETQKVSMDIELNRGFILQAEVGKEEKGKFSLKWKHNY